MTRLRQLVLKHRIAAGAIALAVALFAVWKVYMAVGVGGTPSAPAAVRQPASPAPAASTGTTGTPPAGPAGGAALRAASHLTGAPLTTIPGASPSAGAVAADGSPSGTTPAAPGASAGATPAKTVSPDGATPPPPGTGRPDPFVPLVSSAAPSPAAPPLPPVPPLAPGALGPSAPTLPGLGPSAQTNPGAQLRLTGIVYGESALAIINDGAASYIVAPGDTVASGLRLTAIDAANGTVTLASNKQSLQLSLGGGSSR
jgi:hypothetical protein